MLEALVILWHKSLKFEHTMYTDAMAAATRRQSESDAEITHVFKNQNQDNTL